MKTIHKRLILLGLLQACIVMGGWNCPQEMEKRPECVITIEWEEQQDLRDDLPFYKMKGKMLDEDEFSKLAKRNIGGMTYRGHRFYRGPLARQEAPEALIFDFAMRRIKNNYTRIDIYLTCKIPVNINFQSFKGGVLRHSETKVGISWPVELPPGEYHLEAFMPEPVKGMEEN